ncbi:uncharacterized protein [Antedon mediterranea]|uniref:uncharacterized protein isoform X2 n=1 Tax=Antedon mediterranea TaxID=105859 RepID=UPI003AF71E44
MVSNGYPSIPSDVNPGANKNNYGVDILQVQAECYMSKKVNSSGLYCYDAWHTSMTISECCCLIGQGWGRPCQRCPHTDSKLFSELCTSASGFGAAHRDPSATKNQFVYPIPPFMSSSDSQSESGSLSIKAPPVVLAPETESLSTLVGFDLCYELVYFHNDTTVCGLVMTYLLTYTDCCCGYPGIGRGWGQECIQCPLPNSNDFDDMCGFSVSFDHSTYISYRPEISIPDYDNSQFGCYGPMLVSNTSSYDSGAHCSNNMLASGASEVECCCLLNGESWGSECSACAPIGTDDFSALCDDDYREAEKQIPLEVPLYERCYATYNGSNGGHCEGILYIDVTWQQCCCMVYGKAWGGSCFPCPPSGSESYKSICNVPLISIDYDPSDLCRRDSCSPGHCQIVNLNTEVCSCPAGYKQSRKGLTCQDADECMLQQGLCEPGACFNTLGSYYCFCPDGFAHFQGEQHCRDLNECASIGDQCHPGYCVNLEGSFECRCPIGFYYNRDQVMCDDLNECSVNVMLCYPGICLNTEGSFKCVCPYNYEYDIRRQLCIPRSKFTSIAIMIPSLPERQYNPDQAENPENQPDKAIGKVSGISKGVTTDGGDCNEMDLMPNLADICSPSVRVNVTLEFIVKHNVTNDNEEQWLRKLMELHFKTEINVGIVDEIDGKPHGFAHPWEVKKFSGFVSEMCTQLHVVHSSFETVVEHVSNNSKTQVYFSLTVIRASFSEYVDEVDLEMNCVISKHNYSETYFIESGHSNFVYISASNILYVPSQVEFQKVHRFSDSGDSCQETSLYVCSNVETLEHCPPLVLNSTISLNTTVSVTTNEGVEPTLTNQSMLHPRGRPEVCRSLKRDTLNYTPTSFFPPDSDHMQVIISCIGILLSLVALTITFIVRCVFRSLRTLLGKILMNLIGALFIGQLGVLLQGQGVAYPILCTTIAAVMHYVWLAAFFWMNAMALDFFFTFGSKVKLRKRHSKRKILQAYMFYGWGAPIPIIILCLVIHFEQFNNLRFRYGNEFACWIYDEKSTLLAFGLPLMIILLFNILLFICAVIGLRLTKVVNKVGDAKNTRLKRFRTDLLVYVKMSTLMGFTWIFGFVSAFTQLKIFRYTFIVLNSLQGVFIFMAFTCNKHVRKEVKRCMNRGLQNAGRDQRKSSAGKFNSSDVTRQSDEPVKNNVSKLTHL